MNKNYFFTLYGKPKAQQRPRFFRKVDGAVRTYDPCQEDKKQDRVLFLSQFKKNDLVRKIEEPCEVKIISYHKCTQRKLFGAYRPLMPDVDNVAKYYLDVMNSLIYDDDRRICKLDIEKRYAEGKGKERVEIRIRILEEGSDG